MSDSHNRSLGQSRRVGGGGWSWRVGTLFGIPVYGYAGLPVARGGTTVQHTIGRSRWHAP